MSVDPKRQKAEKYRGWLTPPQAIKALSSIYRIDSARSDIFARLQAGLIVAYAAKVYAPDDEDDITHVEIQAAVWRGVDLHDLVKSHFWETGNFTSIVYVPQTGDTIDDVRHIGVLLDPAAIQAILNSHGVAAAPEAMPAIAAPADPPIEQNAPEERQPDKERAAAIAKPKGTVNPTMLASWFAVFAQAFPEERNADRIWEAAKTFFCDREVPRSRMRPAMDKVMGKRARGRRATPKSDDAAN